MSNIPENSQTPPADGPPTQEQLLADPRMQELLENYNPLHRTSFVQGYLRVLQDLHYNGVTHESNLEYLLHQHDKEAYKYLWMIQHQKLFDLECQWRAELIELPEARITADFDDWHGYIEECPVLPPITPDELALLDAFMSQVTDDEDLHVGDPGQTFWSRRRYPHFHDDDDEETFWPWTEFWDLHRGTGYLRELPDLRGDKEHRYTRAAIDELHRVSPYVAPPEDPRPHIPTWGDEYEGMVRDLLRRCEPAAKLRQYEAKQQLEAYDASEDRLDLPLALERLQNAGPVLVPIEAHADWRQAIIAAGHRHYIDQLRAALPHVYEEYRQRLELGICLEPAESRRYRERGSMFGHSEKQIREGRRLLGEPDDLNF